MSERRIKDEVGWEKVHRTDPPYVGVTLTERQWDVVREACYRRGTKQATDMAMRIFRQGGTSFYFVIHDADPMGASDG
jgi:hypothetical protein